MISRFDNKDFREQFQTALKDEFKNFNAKALELAESAGKIKVKSADQLGIAKSRILDIASWIKNLEKVHKSIKDPLLTLSRMVDGEKKKIEESFESSKKSINTTITFYETLEKRRIAMELEEEKRLKAEKDALVMKDVARIELMVSNVRAMLYGGFVTNSKGTTQRPGSFTLAEVENVENIVKTSLPAATAFHSDCLPVYQNAVKLLGEIINARKESVMTTQGTTLSDTEAALAIESSSIVADQARVIRQEDKKLDKQIENTEKGFRRTIEYEVFDLNRVPKEFLMLDESKINQYKIDHRDEILEKLKAVEGTGHGIIEGIRFRVNQTSIVR
jgi:hypothetical protein